MGAKLSPPSSGIDKTKIHVQKKNMDFLLVFIFLILNSQFNSLSLYTQNLPIFLFVERGLILLKNLQKEV